MKKRNLNENLLSFYIKVFNDYTPKTLGEKIGLSGQSVSSWMSGSKPIPLKRAKLMKDIPPFSHWGLDAKMLKDLLEWEAGDTEIITLLLLTETIDDDSFVDSLPPSLIDQNLTQVNKNITSTENEPEKMIYEARKAKYEAWLSLKAARENERNKIQEAENHNTLIERMDDILDTIIETLHEEFNVTKEDSKGTETFIYNRIFTEDGELRSQLKEVTEGMIQVYFDKDIPLSDYSKKIFLEHLSQRVQSTEFTDVDDIQEMMNNYQALINHAKNRKK